MAATFEQRLQSFNPRAREGRDVIAGKARITSAVSIHAPARGATRRTVRRIMPILCFNPRAREGRDLRFFLRLLIELLFQSTRPRGARRRPREVARRHHSFQSTRPRGARPRKR